MDESPEQRQRQDEAVRKGASGLGAADAPEGGRPRSEHDQGRHRPGAERFRGIDHHPGGERKLGVEAFVEIGEDRNHAPEDHRDDQRPDGAHHRRVGEGGAHLGGDPGRLFEFVGEPRQAAVQPPAGLADRGHGHREPLEDPGMAAHRLGERTAGLDIAGHRPDRAPEPPVVLLAVEHGEALRERQPRPHHHRELPHHHRDLPAADREQRPEPSGERARIPVRNPVRVPARNPVGIPAAARGPRPGGAAEAGERRHQQVRSGRSRAVAPEPPLIRARSRPNAGWRPGRPARWRRRAHRRG